MAPAWSRMIWNPRGCGTARASHPVTMSAWLQISRFASTIPALRAYDLRSHIARIRERSDLDEDQVRALVYEEPRAARAERHKAA
jgi:hypothetical protein